LKFDILAVPGTEPLGPTWYTGEDDLSRTPKDIKPGDLVDGGGAPLPPARVRLPSDC